MITLNSTVILRLAQDTCARRSVYYYVQLWNLLSEEKINNRSVAHDNREVRKWDEIY